MRAAARFLADDSLVTTQIIKVIIMKMFHRQTKKSTSSSGNTHTLGGRFIGRHHKGDIGTAIYFKKYDIFEKDEKSKKKYSISYAHNYAANTAAASCCSALTCVFSFTPNSTKMTASLYMEELQIDDDDAAVRRF